MTSVANDLSSDMVKINFVTSTFIGFDQKEIGKSSYDDLLYIRRVIYSYLTNPKLKKRNVDFKKAFVRINKELKQRRKNKPESKTKIKYDNQNVETDECSSDVSNSQKVLPFRESNYFSGIQFPDFLNDKNSNIKINQSYSNVTNFSCECQHCNLHTFSENIIRFTNERKKEIINH